MIAARAARKLAPYVRKSGERVAVLRQALEGTQAAVCDFTLQQHDEYRRRYLLQSEHLRAAIIAFEQAAADLALVMERQVDG